MVPSRPVRARLTPKVEGQGKVRQRYLVPHKRQQPAIAGCFPKRSGWRGQTFPRPIRDESGADLHQPDRRSVLAPFAPRLAALAAGQLDVEGPAHRAVASHLGRSAAGIAARAVHRCTCGVSPLVRVDDHGHRQTARRAFEHRQVAQPGRLVRHRRGGLCRWSARTPNSRSACAGACGRPQPARAAP